MSLVIIGSIRSSWFIATSCRISVRGLPARIARQGLHHLDMLRRFRALRRREFAAQLRFQRGPVGLDEGIKPDAGAAVGERDDGGVADVGIFPDQVDQHRRVIDQPPAAAFAVGEIEQAAGDGAVDLLAGRQPDAGDQRFARQNLALLRRQRLRRVAALVLEQMPEILIGRDPEQPAARLEAGRELEVGDDRRGRRCRAASSVPWRDRYGRCRRDAACAAPAWRNGNRRRRHAVLPDAAPRRR